jgi:hypothetical protein
VRLHNTARKTLHNSLVGDIELTGDAMELTGDGLVIIAYSTAPGSPAEENLSFLASWAAQHHPTKPADGNEKPAISPTSQPTSPDHAPVYDIDPRTRRSRDF